MMTTIYATDIHVSQLCRKVKLRVRARSSRAAYNVSVYAGLFGRTQAAKSLGAFALNTTSLTWSTLDLTVPTNPRSDGQRQRLTFRMWFTPWTIGGDALGAPIAISSVTDNTITVATASSGAVLKGDMAYFPGTGIAPRPIQYKTVGVTNTIIHAHDTMPWVPYPPVAGTDTFNARQCATLEIASIQMYEYGRSGSFSDLVSRI